MDKVIFEKKPLVSDKIIRNERDAKILLIDPERPSWVVVSKSMADLLCKLDGSKTVEQIIKETNDRVQTDVSKQLISGFEKLFRLGFFKNDDNYPSCQSETLDQVYFNLTKKCNLQCIYCYASAGKTNEVKEMPLNFWNSVVMQLKQLNPTSSICLTGGEPLLFDGFWQLAERVRENGLGLSLITNGTLAKPDDAPRLKSLFHNIRISLDSLDENINSVTRGTGVLEKTRRLIDCLVAEDFKPTVMVVVTRENAHRLSDFRAVFQDRVNMIYQPMYVMGRACGEDILGLTAAEYYGVLDSAKIDKMKEENTLVRNRKLLWCGMGRNVLSVEADGRVYPCQLLHNEEFQLGDLNQDDISEIWLKSSFRKNSVDDIEECCTCEIKYFCGAPCRARAYFVTGNIFEKDPLCPDFIKRSHIDNMFAS
jgi:radical SAM protein with 4Fe4S-binding SPASM domain